MADRRQPLAAQIGEDRARPADEIGEARGRASENAPQQAEDQQGQDRDARPDVPVESGRSSADHQLKPISATSSPVEQPGRQVPDAARLHGSRRALSRRLRAHDRGRGRPCRSCRGRRARRVIAARSLPCAAALNACAAAWKACVLAAKSSRLLPDLRPWRGSCRRPGRCPAGTSPATCGAKRGDGRRRARAPRRGWGCRSSVRALAAFIASPMSSMPSWRSCMSFFACSPRAGAAAAVRAAAAPARWQQHRSRIGRGLIGLVVGTWPQARSSNAAAAISNQAHSSLLLRRRADFQLSSIILMIPEKSLFPPPRSTKRW